MLIFCCSKCMPLLYVEYCFFGSSTNYARVAKHFTEGRINLSTPEMGPTTAATNKTRRIIRLV